MPKKKANMKIMDAEKKNLIKDAARRLKGYQKRDYIALISLTIFKEMHARLRERWGGEEYVFKRA